MQIHEPPTNAALGLIFAIMLLDIVGISMLYPIAAYLVLRYSNDAFMVTLLTVIYAGAQFVAAPLLLLVTDRTGLGGGGVGKGGYGWVGRWVG